MKRTFALLICLSTTSCIFAMQKSKSLTDLDERYVLPTSPDELIPLRWELYREIAEDTPINIKIEILGALLALANLTNGDSKKVLKLKEKIVLERKQLEEMDMPLSDF